MKKEHPNLEVLKQLDLTNIEACADVISEDFIWHYFNKELPEVHGDYHGVEGLGYFFKKMAGTTDGTFKVNVIAAIPMGDELVVTHVKDTMLLNDKHMVVDAVVVWSVANGKIKEAWDIPAIHSVKVIES